MPRVPTVECQSPAIQAADAGVNLCQILRPCPGTVRRCAFVARACRARSVKRPRLWTKAQVRIRAGRAAGLGGRVDSRIATPTKLREPETTAQLAITPRGPPASRNNLPFYFLDRPPAPVPSRLLRSHSIASDARRCSSVVACDMCSRQAVASGTMTARKPAARGISHPAHAERPDCTKRRPTRL